MANHYPSGSTIRHGALETYEVIIVHHALDRHHRRSLERGLGRRAYGNSEPEHCCMPIERLRSYRSASRRIKSRVVYSSANATTTKLT